MNLQKFSLCMKTVAFRRLTILRNRSYFKPKPNTTMKFSSFAIAAAAIATSGVSGFSAPAKFGVRALTELQSTAIDADTKTALATAANEARGLAMDSIAAAHSGHMGLPLGAAEIGASLYGSQVRKPFLFLSKIKIRHSLSHLVFSFLSR